MSAVPPKCLQCKRDLRYDLAHLRYRCPACDATHAAGDIWRIGGETLGRQVARLVHKLGQWLGK
ncbi:MAG: hypothetical protein ACREKR_05030 [Candidatus Methylomirabilales bacterium]